MLNLRTMHKDSSPLREEAEKLLHEHLEKGCEALNLPLFRITFDFDLTGSTAGRAWVRSCHISLNWPLLLQEGSAFLTRTVPHEVAHLLDYAKFQGHGHGPTWRFCMEILGVSDVTRCHSYDTQHVSRGQTCHAYVCDNGHTLNLSTTKHNRLKKVPYLYHCGACQGALHKPEK